MNMKTKILIIGLLVSLMCLSQNDSNLGYMFINENTIPLDKQAHFAGGAFFAVGGYSLGYGAYENRKRGKFWGIVTPILAGTVKELCDIKTTGFDVKDLAYTAVGGILTTHTIDFYVGKKIKK